jgi:biotin-(acetyl-CoA carboxylase) ligase
VGAEDVARSSLIAAICKELEPFLRMPADRSWLEDYRTYSCVIGKRVCWSCGDVTAEGSAVGVDGDGALLVQAEDGRILPLRTGEVSLRVMG